MVNPLSVSVQPSGKKRLILDLRCVNKHIIKQRVKYEDWRIGLSYFQNGAFMISFDLKIFNGSCDFSKSPFVTSFGLFEINLFFVVWK